MKLNDPLLALCNGDPEKFLALTPAEIIEHGRNCPQLLQHVALSEEHRLSEALSAQKKADKEQKRLDKLKELDRKSAEKAYLASLSPEARKEHKRKAKIAKEMDKAGEAKLPL